MNPISGTGTTFIRHQDLIQKYEMLRSHVLTDFDFNSTPDMGYVLFIRQGMLVWIKNCNYLNKKTGNTSDANEYKSMPNLTRNKLVLLLSEIIINQRRKSYG